jgi:addiction module HigA family antidote
MTVGKMIRKPLHPGEILREEFMPDYGLTVKDMAEKLGVSRQSVNELIHERRSLSTKMAVRLSACFGNSAEQWLNIQLALDIWETEKTLGDKLSQVERLSARA